MILRSWHGIIPKTSGEEFELHFRATILPEIRGHKGNAGAFFRRETQGAHDHVFLLTYWDDWDSVRAFAGETPQVAVTYPDDSRFGLIGDPIVLHQPCTEMLPWFGESPAPAIAGDRSASPLECLNPAGLPTPEHFSHAIVARGKRIVFIAGQVSEDQEGHVIGVGDMVAQSRQVFANIGRALAAAGARPDQVAKLTIFVAGYRREYLEMIEEGRVALFGDHKPTDTLIGVATLTRPEYLLEVDAIAVVDDV